ncbi:unnamed protein product [Albugo candida]|uniref:Uncharacterized protein n=1 Tax=Albugo candida TaxID=65357 RepID=A0A024G307_9STRA|nr:unnamed protein product [Albugo candida]|eukprot:CCI41238.1 unnamed protein product [Albugo candida]
MSNKTYIECLNFGSTTSPLFADKMMKISCTLKSLSLAKSALHIPFLEVGWCKHILEYLFMGLTAIPSSLDYVSRVQNSIDYCRCVNCLYKEIFLNQLNLLIGLGRQNCDHPRVLTFFSITINIVSVFTKVLHSLNTTGNQFGDLKSVWNCQVSMNRVIGDTVSIRKMHARNFMHLRPEYKRSMKIKDKFVKDSVQSGVIMFG